MKHFIWVLLTLALNAESSHAQESYRYVDSYGGESLLTLGEGIPTCEGTTTPEISNGRFKHYQIIYDLKLCTVEDRPGYLKGVMLGKNASAINTEVMIIVGEEYLKRKEWMEKKNPLYKPLLENMDAKTGYCPDSSSAIIKRPNPWRLLDFTNVCLEPHSH